MWVQKNLSEKNYWSKKKNVVPKKKLGFKQLEDQKMCPKIKENKKVPKILSPKICRVQNIKFPKNLFQKFSSNSGQ